MRTIILSAVLSLSVSLPSVRAETTVPGEEAAFELTTSPCVDPRHEEHSLIDRAHGAMSLGVCWPGQWFDRFFAPPGEVQPDPSGLMISIIGAQRWQENGDHDTEARVRASAELPNLSRRLSLVFRNDDDVDSDFASATDTRPQEVGGGADTTFRGALRWAARQRKKYNIDVEGGLRSELLAFVRVRYRFNTPIPDSEWAFRFTEAVQWRDKLGFSAQSRFEFDRPLGERLVFRSTSQGERSEWLNEQGLGWDLNQNVALFYRIDRRSALLTTVGVQGFSEPSATIDVWRAGVRYRRNIWRPWLFWEVEPFNLWPRDENYRSISGVVLRLETRFGLYEGQ